MQAIARANRVHKNKVSGAIVDYIGVFRNLQKALSIYGAGDEGDSPIIDKAVLLKQLQQFVLEADKFCKNKKIDIKAIFQAESFKRIKLFDDAVEKIVGNEKDKKKYLSLVNHLWKMYKSILPEPKVKELKPHVMIHKIIFKKIKLLTPPVDVSEVMDKIDQLLEDSIDTSGYIIKEKDLKKRYVDLSKIDFDKLRDKFKKNKNTEADLLKNAIQEKVKKMVKINPSRIDFFEKLQKLIDDYNNNSINVEELFKLLTEFVNDLNEEDRRHFAEQLTEEELTVFDILTKPRIEMNDKDVKKVKKIAKTLLAKLKNEKITLDWRKRQASRASVKVAIKDELEQLPECYKEIYDQKCKLLYQHVYENYFNPGQNTYA
jgi:type I restriction enzyme R subunit